MTALERARANLADAEASLAAGTNPYAEQNIASARKRLATLEAAARVLTPPAPPLPASSSLPASPTSPAPACSSPELARVETVKTPTFTGTREERLRRLAAAWKADETTLEAAIRNGTDPDTFALIVSREALVKAKAREILSA